MSAPFQLPQGFVVGDAFQALNASAHDDNLADGIGQGYGVIGYKGKGWTLRYRGQVKPFLRPDDGTPASYIDVIILGSPKAKAKNYFKAYVQGQSEGERPLCSSINGEVPDAGVTQKQSETCALCPRNEWKTDAKTGRKSRECQDHKRLAVLLMPKTAQAILGSPLLEPVYLKVPPDSLQAIAQMGDNMAKQGLHYSSYVTRLSFDPTKAHPSIVFTPVQGLTNEEFPVVADLRQNPLVDRIMYGDAAIVGVTAVANALAIGHTSTGLIAAVKQAALPPAAAPSVVPAQQVDTSYVDQLVDQGDVRSLASLHPSAGVTMRQMERAQDVQEAQSRKVTQADVGVAELSDKDLDAKIAAMIKSQR